MPQVELLKPRVSAALHAAIAEIREADVEPTIDEIIWLHNLVEAHVLPSTASAPDATRYPFKVGRVWFYPLTMAAHIWYKERASVWWYDDDSKRNDAFAFAMAHSDGETNVFPKLMESPILARIQVRSWAVNHLTLTRRTVIWAINQFYDAGEPVTVDGEGVVKAKADDDETVFEWGTLTAFVAATYSMDPERVQRLSMNEVLGLARRAPKPPGAKGPDTDALAIRANANLRLAIRHIIRTHKEAGNES